MSMNYGERELQCMNEIMMYNDKRIQIGGDFYLNMGIFIYYGTEIYNNRIRKKPNPWVI